MSQRRVIGWILVVIGPLSMALSGVMLSMDFEVKRLLLLVAAGLVPTIYGIAILANTSTAARPRDGATSIGLKLTAIHALIAIALLEVVINRIAVPMLRPPSGTPPSWHTVLDYGGLFLFYFTGSLAALVIFTRCYSAIVAQRGLRDTLAHGVLGVAALVAAIPLVVSAPAWMSLPLELLFAGAVVALVASVYDKDRDLGVQFGVSVIAIPLLVHTAAVIGAEFFWPESTFDGPGQEITKAGVTSLCLAALATPYCFAPRPFARAVTRPVPVVVAMSIAAAGAVLARSFYTVTAKSASLAIGVEMQQHHPDQRLALYLLAIATLAWTLTSCVAAASEARRTIGAGLALILLGGYGFHWPHHYLLPLLGLGLIVDAARRVRDEELAELPIASEAPPIADTTWSSYIGTVVHGLKRTMKEVHSLTTRGEGGLASSVIVGEADGRTMRARIDRVDGGVLALDIVVGREIDELRGATLTMWAIPARGAGVNPPGPPATPLFKTGDARFDERFKTRGSALVFSRLLDEDLRARAVATLDGWLAYWEREGLRYRVYPGHGAPLDHPLPLPDLAVGKVPHPERLLAVIELLAEAGKRVLEHSPPAEPTSLDGSGLDSAP